MRRIVRWLKNPLLNGSLVFALLWAVPGWAGDVAVGLGIIKTLSATPATRAAASAEGQAIASFCANCHGDTGNSRFPEVPNLAGQNPAYLLTQMKKFETGERKDEFMQKLIKLLNDRERATIVIYYADSVVVPSRPKPGPLAAQGGAQFTRLCVRCHGEKALGSETVPRLAGQQAKYLRVSLERYRKLTGERFFPQMTAATSQIPEADVDAVVDYLASFR
jgi:cytochrome c553